MATERKRKVTFYLPEALLRAARVRAARTDVRDSEVIEEALRSYLGFDLLEDVWARSDLDENQAVMLAVTEQHAMRAKRRAAGGS